MDKIFYLAQIFEGLNTLFIVLLVISVIVSVVSLLGIVFQEDDDDVERLIKLSAYAGVAAIVFALGMIFTPTKQTYLFMVGGRAVETIIENNPQVNEIPANTIELINEYIKAETETIRNKKTRNE